MASIKDLERTGNEKTMTPVSSVVVGEMLKENLVSDLPELQDLQEVSPEDDKRILRKIDMILPPMLLVTYSFKFLDQQAMSYSANFGLREDMNLSLNQYAWASGTIINLAIVIRQPIVGRVLQKVPIGRCVATSVCIWGILLMCTAAARSFAAIAVSRVLLGFSEAGITPAMILIISMWFKREGEQPGRQGAWFLGNAIAQMTGGLIGYGIGHIKSDLNVGPWIWFFIIAGSVTICWGAQLFFTLPDSPLSARFLSREDRILAKWEQVRECVLDVNIWLYCVTVGLSAIPSGGVASFGNIVIKGFGFSPLVTTLLSIPLGGIQVTCIIISWWLTARFKNIRCWISSLSQVPPLVGCILLMTLDLDNHVGLLLSYYAIQTHTLNSVMTYASFTGNTSGFTKKVVGTGMMFVCSSVGLMIGPQLFKSNEAPRYSTAFITSINARKQLRPEASTASEEEIAREGLMDLTDKRKPHFRYVY
ncbi:major facilitator superfamily domain-containing protein [Aspergillus karnatakaensis]|uniref:major facilitator superfamily domain-containing protein n=1 Tax=Aspergillus karnatakaensis TaxID=1810916 RepID=UPI003CCDB32E